MSEGLGETLHALGDVVDEIEAAGGRVTGIETAADGDPDDPATTIDVAFSLAGATDLELALASASLEPDGTLSVRLRTGGADGSVSADGGARKVGAVPDDPAIEAPEQDAEEPPYKDPERLRAVYAAHDSFPAMTEALGVDVTPQTVRRHMIEAGIHEPEQPPEAEPDPVEEGTEVTDGGGAEPDAGEDTPPALADFEDVSLDELTEAVRSARTIREVGKRLGVPRERAFRLLNTLGLIDLVSGRLRSADRRVSVEELQERIQRATAEE